MCIFKIKSLIEFLPEQWEKREGQGKKERKVPSIWSVNAPGDLKYLWAQSNTDPTLNSLSHSSSPFQIITPEATLDSLLYPGMAKSQQSLFLLSTLLATACSVIPLTPAFLPYKNIYFLKI